MKMTCLQSTDFLNCGFQLFAVDVENNIWFGVRHYCKLHTYFRTFTCVRDLVIGSYLWFD